MNIVEKIDRAVNLDREMKEKKKELDSIKAELQTIALNEMENKNLKWKQLFGNEGRCDVAYKEKLEVDNYSLLKELFGDLLDGKVTKEEEIKYKLQSRFKDALLALYKGSYKNHDLKKMLADLGLDDKAIKTALKKLKGDYVKDKDVLNSLGIIGELEEELDVIKEAKNFELVDRYFGIDEIDTAKLKKAIWVEDGLSIGISYEK